MRIVQNNETVLIGAGEAYKPVCRECHKFFSMEREKGNLNIDNILKSNENKENNENISLKVKEDKDGSSSGDETSLSSSTKEIAKVSVK